MGIPKGKRRKDIQLSPNEVLDAEPDVVQKRLVWTAGGGNNLIYANVDAFGIPPVGNNIAPNSAPYNAGNTFPNGAEWGLYAPPGYRPMMGCFFSVWTNVDPAEIWFVDPNPGPATPYGGIRVTPVDSNNDYWLYDAWRDPSVGPLFMYRLTPEGADPLQSGDFYIRDPKIATTTLVPNINFDPSNTTSRVIRIVEEHPALVFPLFMAGPPIQWQLIWQMVDGSGVFLPFGSVWLDADHKLLGVGVRKLTHHANAALALFDWDHALEGYFVYDLRRDESGQSPVDYIDYYILEYDSAGPTLNVLFSSPPGGVRVPPLVGPGANTFEGIGDDENYIDPLGNPCIALTLAETPLHEPKTTPGIVALFNVHYATLFPLRRLPPPTVEGTFHVLTPNYGVNPYPRKDPEPMEVNGWVYIYNRERDMSIAPNPPWKMHRTLAWVP